MLRSVAALAATAVFASVAVAHDGVKNPVVLERMKVMGEIREASKTLGQMASGKTAYDQAAMDSAAQDLKAAAELIVTKFEANEDDPKSEATPAIWANFADFSSKAEGLIVAATALDSVTSQDTLGVAMKAVGNSCRDCHKPYRAKR